MSRQGDKWGQSVKESLYIGLLEYFHFVPLKKIVPADGDKTASDPLKCGFANGDKFVPGRNTKTSN